MTSNAAATEQVWALLSDKLRSFFRRRTSDDQVAEDLLQETFVRIHRKLGDIDDIERINAWVFQIARHLVVDHYRIQSRDAAAVANDIEADTPNEANLNDLVAGWLPRMISQLPPKSCLLIDFFTRF